MRFSSRPNVRRRAGLIVAVALSTAACTSGSDAGTGATIDTTIETGIGSTADVALDDGTDDEAVDQFSTDEPDPVVVDVNPTDTLADDVIIATEDGVVPATTVELAPPISANAPASAPTPAAVELPDPSSVQRIISLSPTHTETIAALGALDLLVAVGPNSDFPAGVEELHRAGISAAADGNVEAVLELEPDLVLIGDDLLGIADVFARAGVATWAGPPATTLDEIYEQIEGLAAAIGREEEGTELIGDLETRVATIVDAVADVAIQAPTFFHELNPDLATPTDPGLLADLYGQLGLTNIAAPTGTPSGRVTSDEVIAADPTVILLADAQCCGVTADSVASRPGWSDLSAVNDGTVVALPNALVRRWGPRAVDLIELVGGALIVAQ